MKKLIMGGSRWIWRVLTIFNYFPASTQEGFIFYFWGPIASEAVSWISTISLGSSSQSGIGSSTVVHLLSGPEAASCKVTIFSSSLKYNFVLAWGIPSLRSSYLPGVDMGSQSRSGYDV